MRIIPMGIAVSLAAYSATVFGVVTAGAADHVDCAFLVEQWDRKLAEINSLQVVWLTFVSNPKETTSGNDAPPIIPSANAEPFFLQLYQKTAVDETMELWVFDKNALTHTAKYGEATTGPPPRPHIPFAACDFPTKEVYESLKRGETVISLTEEPRGVSPKLLLTTLWSSVEGKPPSARFFTVVDPALGYAPIECKVKFIFPDGDRLVQMDRWSRHVQVLKDLWLPQEHDGLLYTSEGGVRLRNKNIVLKFQVNCESPRTDP